MTKTGWTNVISLAVVSLGSTARADGILNGLFSNGLDGWEHVGDVTGVSTSGYTYVRLQETYAATPDDPENLRRPKASRTRLFQEFTVPADAGDLSLRFRFAFSPRVRTTVVPADAFTAHLVTTNGTRVLPDAGDAPSFSSAFFYIDSDGRLVYDTAHVDVQMTPGPDGMYGVTLKELDSNGLVGQRLRLEFNLATADNGVTSAVFMDGVADGSAFVCPEGYCCDVFAQLVGGPINDSDPCTLDSCNGATPVHEEIPCCDGCGPTNEDNISIAIMVDASPSFSDADFNAVRDAIINITKYLELAGTTPEIMVGRFSGGLATALPNPWSEMYWASVDAGFTTNGAQIRSVVENTSVFTKTGTASPLESGIAVAWAEHVANSTGARKYIVLVTDGWANFRTSGGNYQSRDTSACGYSTPQAPHCCQQSQLKCPPDGSGEVFSASYCCLSEPPDECCVGSPPGTPPCNAVGCGENEFCHCDCIPAKGLAEETADGAKTANIKIAVVHVLSTGSANCSDNPAFISGAVSFLQNDIANAGFFVPDSGSPDRIECAFYDLIDAIICDDGNPNTTDCNTNGTCSSSM